jgi:hypothetical protein
LHDEAGFRDACLQMMEQFPKSAPVVVTHDGLHWGDYEHAKEMFALHGSNWDCEAVFTNRSVIGFVNDAAYLFLLPRMINCAFSAKGIDADILDYVIFALRDKIPRYPELFSPAQCSALIPPLRNLLGHVCDEYPDPGFEETEVELQRILGALGADAVL